MGYYLTGRNSAWYPSAMGNLSPKNLPEHMQSADLKDLLPLKIYTDLENKLYDHVDVYIDTVLLPMVLQKERTWDTFYPYRKALLQFQAWGKRRGNPPVTHDVIRSFKSYLVNKPIEGTSKKLKPATVNAYLTALRVFYEYYAERRFVAYNPVKLVKGVKRKSGVHQKGALTISEAKRLLASVRSEIPGHVDTLKELRDYAMIYLMLKTGLREVEVVRALVGDMTTVDDRNVLYVHGKGDREKSKLVVLDDKVYNALMDYVNRRGADDEDPLFAKLVLPSPPNEKKKNKRTKDPRVWTVGLTTHQVRTIVRFYLYKSGIKTRQRPRPEITVHSLRHTTANLALDGGAPIVQVQEMMRHAKIETTMIYVKQWNRVSQAAELHIKQI